MNKKYSQDENIIRKLRIYKRGIRIKAVWSSSEYAKNNKLELLDFGNFVG